MSNLDKLITQFEKFPGIGARQARRFAFHVLTMPKESTAELASLITSIQSTVTVCDSCKRFFATGYNDTLCGICSDGSRDWSKLMVVSADSDITAIERAGTYDGLYFVLGGMVPLLDTKEQSTLRGGALKSLVETRLSDGLEEVILAFAVNPDGENTGRFIESILKDVPTVEQLKISYLGRGLSTGSELEYADPETIKNAWQNRS
ncbi:toprim domain-containing protein [Candidatus Pacebacteria bacterium]|nr:toprim domain-containing protein [Candidatus Paceibacterota bacterium]